MDLNGLLNKLSRLENISRASKARRLLYTPFKYIFAIVFKQVIYRVTGKELKRRTGLFWGDKATIALPGSMDLFLLGCKTDGPEIRLTRFILKNLREADLFVDIGSHIGYYSLLSSFCVGEKGKVVSIEASPSSFLLLKKNILKHPNIEAFNIALSDKEEIIDFFEFPAPYAEYNTMSPMQYEGQQWFSNAGLNKIPVTTMRGDQLLQGYARTPAIIKIDVEGAENRVVEGLKDYLNKNNPYVVMEFLSGKRNNRSHREADNLLRLAGYLAYRIGNNGELIILNKPVKDHIDDSSMESDNIVYFKQNV